jgi:hypothetical protein
MSKFKFALLLSTFSLSIFAQRFPPRDPNPRNPYERLRLCELSRFDLDSKLTSCQRDNLVFAEQRDSIQRKKERAEDQLQLLSNENLNLQNKIADLTTENEILRKKVIASGGVVLPRDEERREPPRRDPREDDRDGRRGPVQFARFFAYASCLDLNNQPTLVNVASAEDRTPELAERAAISKLNLSLRGSCTRPWAKSEELKSSQNTVSCTSFCQTGEARVDPSTSIEQWGRNTAEAEFNALNAQAGRCLSTRAALVLCK